MAVSPFLVESGPGYTARTSGTAIFYFNYARDNLDAPVPVEELLWGQGRRAKTGGRI